MVHPRQINSHSVDVHQRHSVVGEMIFNVLIIPVVGNHCGNQPPLEARHQRSVSYISIGGVEGDGCKGRVAFIDVAGGGATGEDHAADDGSIGLFEILLHGGKKIRVRV